jgi:hypothetical protein
MEPKHEDWNGATRVGGVQMIQTKPLGVLRSALNSCAKVGLPGRGTSPVTGGWGIRVGMGIVDVLRGTSAKRRDV